MCDLLGIDKTHTTAFYPASDGLVERVQHTIEDMLSKYIKENQRDWDEILPFMLMAYRSSKQEATKKKFNVSGSRDRLTSGLTLSIPSNGGRIPK